MDLHWWYNLPHFLSLCLSLSLSLPLPVCTECQMHTIIVSGRHILAQSFIHWCTSTVNICAWPMRHADVPADNTSSAASLPHFCWHGWWPTATWHRHRTKEWQLLKQVNILNINVHQLAQDSMKSSDGCETQQHSNTNEGHQKIRLSVLQTVGLTWWHSSTGKLVSSYFSCLDRHFWIWEAVRSQKSWRSFQVQIQGVIHIGAFKLSEVCVVIINSRWSSTQRLFSTSRHLTAPHITMLLPNDFDSMPYFAFIRRA